jgi:predicted amidophosphoribosyltransferase
MAPANLCILCATAAKLFGPQARCVFSSQISPLTLDVPSQTSAWRAVVRVLRSPVDSLSCALFPAPCCACGSPLLRFSRVPVCDACWDSLEVLSDISCCLCGEDLAVGPRSALHGDREFLCHLCSKVPPPFRRAVSAGTYRTTLRALIHSLKYDGMLPIADGLGRRLALAVLSLERQIGEATAANVPEKADDQLRLVGMPMGATGGQGGPKPVLVIPVPAHGSNRRFSHAELIASAAMRELRALRPEWKLAFAPALLERQRVTEGQAGLTPHQRRVNVRGAFRTPDPAALTQAHVLLIDDIYTTGATARACTRALLKAGAASVWVATVARAQFEHIVRPRLARLAETEGDSEVLGEDLPMQEDVAFWDSGKQHTVH